MTTTRRSYQAIANTEESSLLGPTHRTARHRLPPGYILILAAILGFVVFISIGPTRIDVTRAEVQDDESFFQRTWDQGLSLLGSSHNHRQSGSNHSIKAHDGCEGTVMLVRHCEKSNIKEHCSSIGFERSVYLATLFGDDAGERWPAPSYIFAEGPGGRKKPERRNYREVETVLPIAEKVNITVDSSYDTTSTRKLADHILELFDSGALCGKLAIISWKHSGIPRIAKKLNCGPSKGCPTDYHYAEFDKVWQLKFVYSKMKHSAKKSGKIPHHSLWQISGSVQPENFDPLAFSKIHGDYPKGGTPSTRGQGGWEGKVIDIPEGGGPAKKGTSAAAAAAEKKPAVEKPPPPPPKVEEASNSDKKVDATSAAAEKKMPSAAVVENRPPPKVEEASSSDKKVDASV